METPQIPPSALMPGYGPQPLSPSDERMWAMFTHLSALVGFMVPFGNVIGPLVIWQIFKERSAFVDAHGKESVNFQLIMSIAYLVSMILLVMVFAGQFQGRSSVRSIGLVSVLLPVLGVVSLVLFIIAAVKANNGEEYEYPISSWFIR